MKGCLTLPFRLAFLLLLVAGVFVAWSYRREIRRAVHRLTAESGPPPTTGRADPALVAPARRRLDSLRVRRDSVVLSAADLASLLAAVSTQLVPGAVDSIEVVLDDDDLEMHALVDTRRLPVSLGPAAGMVHDHEFLEAGGQVLFRRSGLAEWRIERVRVRGLPLPRELIDRIMGRFTGSAKGGIVSVPLPGAVSGLRVSRTGLTLYGVAPEGRP